MKIAIVVARFNQDVTELLLEKTVERLNELKVEVEDSDITWVPGACEIPLIAQQYAACDEYDAVICLGAVIRGETDHYKYVCRQVSSGCQKIALDYEVPVIFGVLTTENRQQALARVNGEHSNSGYYFANAAVEMVQIMEQFDFCLEEEEEEIEYA